MDVDERRRDHASTSLQSNARDVEARPPGAAARRDTRARARRRPAGRSAPAARQGQSPPRPAARGRPRPPPRRCREHAELEEPGAGAARSSAARATAARSAPVGSRKRSSKPSALSAFPSAPASTGSSERMPPPARRTRPRSPHSGSSASAVELVPEEQLAQIQEPRVALADGQRRELSASSSGPASRADRRPRSAGVRRRAALPGRQQLRRSRRAHAWLPSGLGEAGLVGLGHLVVALPALVLELDGLDGDGVRVGVEIRRAWYSETQQRYTLYASASCPASL